MERRAASLIGRAAWGALLLAFGFLATMVQMDREARTSLAVARHVPAAFRSYALGTLARQSFADRNDAQGLTYARELVARRPVPAENLSLLTRGLIGKGDTEAALPVMLLAAQRGWRDDFVQYLLISSALQVGDMDVASQRVLARWRLGDSSDSAYALTRDLLIAPGGAERFAGEITKSDAWPTEFFEWSLGTDVPPGAQEAVAKAVRNKGVPIDCGRLTGPLRGLAIRGEGRIAEVIWSGLCKQEDEAAVASFAFQMPADVSGPFDWKYSEEAGLSVDLEEQPAGVGLLYENTMHRPVLFAQRMLALMPGAHRLKIKGPDIAAGSLITRVECLRQDGTIHRIVSTYPTDGVVPFVLPEVGCAVQQISLLTGYGKGRIDSVSITGQVR